MPQSLLHALPSPHGDRSGWPWFDDEIERAYSGLTWPKVTIVTPSFNQGQYLEETIRSVLLQGYPNLEYIIIDGGSSDNSVEIIRKYEAWVTFWVSEPDQGQADAINKGFDRSTGEILGWLNSDDLLYPDAIKHVVEAFQLDRDLEMIYGDVDYGLVWGKVTRRIFGEQMEFREMLTTLQVSIPQQGSLWKRSVLERIGGLDPKWHVVLDREFFLRAAEKCKLKHLHLTLGFFRDHEFSKSSSQQSRWLTELPAMYEDLFNRKEWSSEINALKAETMGVVYITCASIAFRGGQQSASVGYLIKAIICDPLMIFRRYIRNKLIIFIRSKTVHLKSKVS